MTRILSSILFLIACSGCIFTPHRPVAIQPEVTVRSDTLGANQKIFVTVVDERPRVILGTRAQNRGAEITTAGDPSIGIRKAIMEGLQRQGFVPVEAHGPATSTLRVEIRNLEYSIISDFWSASVKVECSLKVVSVADGIGYEKLYRSELRERIYSLQSEEQNDQHINIAVSQAINSLIGDPQLKKSLLAKRT